MQSLKELIEGAFFHSWQRTSMVLGGLILALALPITIILTQQQQDLRQRASGYTCGTGYPQQSGNCPDGWDCQWVTQSNNPFYNRYQCVERNPESGTLPGTQPPTATPYVVPPTDGQEGTQTSFNFNNGQDHCRPSNKNCESFETLISGGCNILPSGKICRLNSPLPAQVPTDSYCSTISPDGYIRYCLPNTVSVPSGWAIQSDAANSVCTTYNGVSSKCYKTNIRAYPETEQKPNCTTVAICDQTTCEAPINTCGSSNGKMSCKYYSHPTAGTNCTPAAAPSQTCGVDKCTSPNTCVNGTCAAPTATPTSIPTSTPTLTPTPTTPAVVVDTSPSPRLTETPKNETLIALTVSLPGIGSNAPVEGLGTLGNNETPKRTTREVEVLLGNSEGVNVTSLASGSLTPVSGTLTFSPASFTYKGVISLGNLPTANYQVFIRLDNSLYKAATGYPLLTLGQTTTIPNIALISGDIDRTNDSNDRMTIDDYNLLIACFKEKEICTPQAKIRADLDDNGIIDTIDLHLMQRAFANRAGDSPL